ncbi:MAG: hypothetical protein QM817_19170 [Archangium sp.]
MRVTPIARTRGAEPSNGASCSTSPSSTTMPATERGSPMSSLTTVRLGVRVVAPVAAFQTWVE